MSIFEKAVLAVILLEIPVQMDVYLDYQDSEAALGALGGWNISITTLGLAVLYGVQLPKAAVRRTGFQPSMLRVFAPALAYIAAVLVSALAAYQIKLSLFELFLLAQAFLLCLYLALRVRGEQDVRFVVALLLAGVVVESLIMIGLRFVVGHSVDIAPLAARMDEHGRVSGTMGSPNTAGSYFVLLLPLALGVLLTGWGARYRILAVTALGLGSIALVLTLSRGAWLSAGLAVAFFCLAAWLRGRLSLGIPAAILLVAMVISVLFAGEIRQRLVRDDRGAAMSRIPLMIMSLEMMDIPPLFGVGPNNQTIAMRQFSASAPFRGGFVYVVHNRYLQVLVETGAVGLITFLLFLASVLRCGWRASSAGAGNLSAVALGMTAGLVGELIHMNVDTYNGRCQNQLLWLAAALVVALLGLTQSPAARRARTC